MFMWNSIYNKSFCKTENIYHHGGYKRQSEKLQSPWGVNFKKPSLDVKVVKRV